MINGIGALLQAAQAQNPDSPFLLAPATTLSYADCHQRCQELAQSLRREPAQRFGCHMADSPELVLLLLAAAISGKSLLVFSHDHSSEKVRQQSQELGIELLISDLSQLETISAAPAQVDNAPATEAATEGELLIHSSGTSGTPKCARYDWQDLIAQVPNTDCHGTQRWLLAYRLNHFAGIQMLLHVLANQQALVIPHSSQVSAALQAATEFGVTHISSTPTFWRFALAALNETLPLQHITLGSEVVTGELLDNLHERFPAARIVHIYATTELGSCVSVSDGKPGLPVAVLSRAATAAVQFRIENDELQVKARHGMQGYLRPEDDQATPPLEGGWRKTGDLVAIEDARIRFRGRRTEIINVGGVKVHPQEVEELVTALPGVKLARAYGQDNPVVGQIVALDVLPEDGFTEQAVEDSIFEAALQLPRHSRPRNLNFVDSLQLNNYKLERR